MSLAAAQTAAVAADPAAPRIAVKAPVRPAPSAAAVYGPLPPPGFVPAAAPAEKRGEASLDPAGLRPAFKQTPTPSRFAFLQRWIPWFGRSAPTPPKAAPTAPAAPSVARKAPAAPTVHVPFLPGPVKSQASMPTAKAKTDAKAPAAVAKSAKPVFGRAPFAPKPRANLGAAFPKAVPQGAPHPAASAEKLGGAQRRLAFQQMPAAAQPNATAARSPAGRTLPASPRYVAPVPTAPALPAAASLNVPDLQLPPLTTITVNRDPLPPIKLGGRNRAELHHFARQARMILLPTREYSTVRAAEGIAGRYVAELHPKVHRPIRTPYKLNLEKHAKIRVPPAPIQYENMVKRLDALFDALALSYPRAIQALWELSEMPANPVRRQARDALFAGIVSHRAGWETVGSNLLEASVAKGIDRDPHYLGLLWGELDHYDSLSQIDRVVARVNPARAELAAPVGDQANYALGRRILAGRAEPALRSEGAESRIVSADLRERLQLLRALGQFRAKVAGDAPVATLRRLEAEGQPGVQQEARLALARALLQKGAAAESLELYRRVEKTGKNRLDVLAEQSFAELKSGLYQESLGKSMGLQSPYFQYGFAPDIHLVEVLSRKSLCDFGGAEDGLARFAARYGREYQGLQAALTQRANPKAFYGELIAYHEKEEPMRYQRYLLRLAPVMENQKTLNAAREELAKVDAVGVRKHTGERPANWDKFLTAMHASWDRRAEGLKVESARTALAEADYLANRLRHAFGQAELLGLDLATAASRNFNLQSALNFPVRKLAEIEHQKDKFHWPFENEVWEDELDFLKMKNASKCAAVAHAD